MDHCPRLFTLVALCTFAAVSAGSADKQSKEKFRLSEQEQRLLDLTNQERKKHDLPPLPPDPILFKVARGHSANMARQEKMDHVLDDKNPFQRIKEAGYAYTFAGENVAYGEVEMAEIIKKWMASPKHRDNILGRRYTAIGLGLARSAKGDVYYTQMFATPKRRN
jgi:uncharacterized protein YkwD